MKKAIVIPARFASTRFPGKPLADIHGKPMIQHVYERMRAVKGIDRLLVATDDSRISEAVQKFGGEVEMTSADCVSGTDRLAEVAKRYPEYEVLINVQGDEPLMEPKAVELALSQLKKDSVTMATLATDFKRPEDRDNPNIVKAVIDPKTHLALSFSRTSIPYRLDQERRHIGLYVYTRETLLFLNSLAPTPNELKERLEQLRAMDHGIKIGVAYLPGLDLIGVDTPEDLEKVRRLRL